MSPIELSRTIRNRIQESSDKWRVTGAESTVTMGSAVQRSRNQTRRSMRVSGMMFASELHPEDHHGAFFEASPRPPHRQHNRL
jgi:hypothetical protein